VFGDILGGLVGRLPGARGAALVDQEGETVDYAGRLLPFELRLAAAYWRIAIDTVSKQPSLRAVRWLCVRAERTSYLVHELPETYALVVVLAPAAAFVDWRRAVAVCTVALSVEAGWRCPEAQASWRLVHVTTDRRNRPTSVEVGGRAWSIEVLGVVANGLGRRERGYRVRLEPGVELTLVREAGGAWYTDERLDEHAAAPFLASPSGALRAPSFVAGSKGGERAMSEPAWQERSGVARRPAARGRVAPGPAGLEATAPQARQKAEPHKGAAGEGPSNKNR
jgi:hypothetical protein